MAKGDITSQVYEYISSAYNDGNTQKYISQYSLEAVSYTHLDVYKRQALS